VQPKKLGVIFEATLRGNVVVCREIKFDRVKEYVIDDQIRDLHHLSRL